MRRLGDPRRHGCPPRPLRLRTASTPPWITAVVLPVLALLLLLPGRPAQAQDAAPQRAGVLVLGVAGLRWDDVGPQTPALQRLATTGAVGALSVKARPDVSCAADGWLTLGAGTRADAFRARPLPCGPALDVGAELVARNADTPDGAVPGALAQALDGRFGTAGPGALLAMQGKQPVDGQPVVIVDAGTLDSGDRAAGLRRADDMVADALARRSAAVDLLVVGVSAGTGEATAHLLVAMATGPSFPRGALRSASTRRAPYVQLVDVAPTVLTALGLPVPRTMDGQPWQVSGPAPSVASLVDLDRRAQGQREATVTFFVVLLAVLLALLLALWRRPRAAELVALTGTAALGASYLANLAPWWRAGVPLLGLLAIVVPLSLAVAAGALALTARAPTGAHPARDRPGAPARAAQLVCAFVGVVVLADLVTGAHLQMSSVAGYSPLVAGRFAGIGNVAFGVLAAAVLLAAGATSRAVTVAAVGLLAVAVDGAPAWGSDVGGVLALVPAFVLLGLLRTGTRITVTRLAVAGGGGAALVTALALVDLRRRPADRSHLGRFAQDVRDGTAGDLLARKAAAVLDLLLTSPVTAALPVVVAVAAYAVVRPPAPLRRALEAAPGWRHGLLAVGLVSLLGFLLNDSGAAVPALALCVAVPATAAVVLRARREQTGPARL